MTIVIIPEWFSENMGYVENYLPASFAKLGHEVHIVTSDFQIYATQAALYQEVYEPFLGPPIVPVGTKELNGFKLHRLPHYQTEYGIGITGLREILSTIKPDIIYLFEINAEITLQIARYKQQLKYLVFTESRLHASVFNPPSTFKEKLDHFFQVRGKWKKVGSSFEKCYPVAPDVLHIICKYFGQDKRKCSLSSLAVDTEKFKSIATNEEMLERIKTRATLGFNESDIICIYTGRFTESKSPNLLAQAIDFLHTQGHTYFKALFVGGGEKDYEGELMKHQGVRLHPFVRADQLVKFYQGADIGVWPMQESTSQLDAIACGLPIIISSRVEDKDRIEGNGLSFEHSDFKDLAAKILDLKDPDFRETLGKAGAEKVRKKFSWDHIAKLRVKDFETALTKDTKFWSHK